MTGCGLVYYDHKTKKKKRKWMKKRGAVGKQEATGAKKFGKSIVNKARGESGDSHMDGNFKQKMAMKAVAAGGAGKITSMI